MNMSRHLDVEIWRVKNRRAGPLNSYSSLVFVQQFDSRQLAEEAFKIIQKTSPKLKRELVDATNPGWVDRSGTMFPLAAGTIEPVIGYIGVYPHDPPFELPPFDSPGTGGVGARVPRGPRPLVGAEAKAIPVEPVFVDHVGYVEQDREFALW